GLMNVTDVLPFVLVNSDNQGSSGTSSNSVVQDYVVLCVAPDVDRCAIRVENRPLGRVHVYIVVHNDGAYDGALSPNPISNFQTNSVCVCWTSNGTSSWQ